MAAANRFKSDWAETAARLVESDLTKLWESLSTDEKMSNYEVERKFIVLRRIISAIRDCHISVRKSNSTAGQSNNSKTEHSEDNWKTTAQSTNSSSEKEQIDL